MMNGLSFEAQSLDEVYWHVMDRFHRGLYDCESAPRGKSIREFIGAQFVIMNPRDRLITSPARAVNYGFAVGELCWYVRGETDLETMLYYNKRMAQFSDDGKTINSAYGHRMFDDVFFDPGGARSSQLDHVIRELVNDPDSRRAVMHINQPRDLSHAVKNGSKDVPCTMSIQLLIRNRRLHMHVLMRSNDIVWGVPYDVFSFTCLQEAFLYMLQAAGVPVDDLGHYYHTAGSLHLYDTHFEMAERISQECGARLDPPMKPFTLEQLEYLAHQAEPAIRSGTGFDIAPLERPNTETVRWMEARLVEHRNKRDAEAAEKARKQAALTELTRLTEEVGGYKDDNVKQA